MHLYASHLKVMILLFSEEVAGANCGTDFKWATDADERNRLWKARHEILYACTALIPGSKVSLCTWLVHISALFLVCAGLGREVKSVIVIGSFCALEGSEVCYCYWMFVHWREVKSYCHWICLCIGSVCAVERSEVCYCHQICLCSSRERTITSRLEDHF